MSDLPTLLPYPFPLPLIIDGKVDRLGYVMAAGLFCRVIRRRDRNGVSVMVSRQEPTPEQQEASEERPVAIVFGDWDGNRLDSGHPIIKYFLGQKIPDLVKLMMLAKIFQVQLYFLGCDLSRGDPVLVDAQFSLNKYASPGMLDDMFGTIFKTQEIIGQILLDKETLAKLVDGQCEFKGDLILKPNRFRIAPVEQTTNGIPLYLEITGLASKSAPIKLQSI